MSTRSPFVTLLSRCTPTGRWSSFGKRVWFTEITHIFNYFFFPCCFIYSIYSWYKILESYLQWNNQIISRKLTQSLLCTPTYTTLRTRLNSHWIASVRCPLLTFSHLNLSPPTFHQRSWIYVDRLTYNGFHEPSVTDASNPKTILKMVGYKWYVIMKHWWIDTDRGRR